MSQKRALSVSRDTPERYRPAPVMSAVKTDTEELDELTRARERRGRSPSPGDPAGRRRGPDRPRHARARLPQGQGAAAGRPPAGRPRGGHGRGGPPRPAASGTRRRCTRPAWPWSAAPISTWPTCPRRALRSRSASRSPFARDAKLGDYKGVEAPRREPEVAEDDIEAEIGRLRESLASLETVDNAAADRRLRGDRLRRHRRRRAVRGRRRARLPARARLRTAVPGFEEQLEGVSAGDERTVKVTFPEDYQAEHLAGKEAAFAVTVKEVKAKQLPELDDDLAVEAGGFDTLDELRERPAQAPQRGAGGGHRPRLARGRRGRRRGQRQGRDPARPRALEGARHVAPDRTPPPAPGPRPRSSTSSS